MLTAMFPKLPQAEVATNPAYSCIMAPFLIKRLIHFAVYMVSAVVFHTPITHFWK